jgi:4-hydroxybenzoate polyprenyltransferase
VSQPLSVQHPRTGPAAIVTAERPPVADAVSRQTWQLIITAIRPHQWVKNLFILTPLLFGKKLFQPAAVGHAFIAVVSFCLVCSALYIINDLVDAPEDRAHPQKRFRPIASGELTQRIAIGSAITLLALSFWTASTLGLSFSLLVLTYFCFMVGYCLSFKRTMILDCMIIAAGFVLRVVSGAVAVETEPTHWLIACAFLLALYLAFSKRRQELLMLSSEAAKHRHVLGQYSVSYLDKVNNILIGATIVCYALYTVAPETVSRFNTDKLIYGTGFVMYGLLRYLALTGTAAAGGNPSKMLLKDRPIMLTVLGWAAYNVVIIYSPALVQLWNQLKA